MTAAGSQARRVAAGVAFLGVVAVAPGLILARPGSSGPAASAPAPVTSPTGSGPAVAVTATVTASTSPGGTARSVTVPPGPPDVLATPVLTRPVGTPARTPYQEFLSRCTPGGHGRAAAGPGAVTAVVFFGAGSGAGSGAGRGVTSCGTAADRSSYWAPVLQVAGEPVEPGIAEIYYKSPVRDYRSVQPFPPGLRLSAGDLSAVHAAGRTGVWSCGGERTPRLPQACPDGAKLVVRLQTPGCWDGRRLDSADHRSHLSYPVDDRCPGSHPVAVPMLELKVSYPVPAGPLTATLSSGPGESFGMGFVNGWQPAALAELVGRCIDAGRRCGLTPD